MADGTRTVNTPRPGQAKTVSPGKIVDETWVAKDLDLAMLRGRVEGRGTGRTTTEVVDLKPGEPDASLLFTAPAGYIAVDPTIPPAAGHTSKGNPICNTRAHLANSPSASSTVAIIGNDRIHLP